MDDQRLQEIREQLIADDKGFYVIKGFYSSDEVQQYLDYCQNFLKEGPVIHDRINTDRMFDYVHPRSHDHVARTSRIYQYFHNHDHGGVADFLGKAIRFRDQIEAVWLDDDVYRSERDKLQNYTIVTSYHGNHGMLPIHRDYYGPAKLPLIQFWVLLSTPEKDYFDGNIILHTATGKTIALEKDLGLQPGDAVIFDKHLEHEVEQTRDAGPQAKGRWTVLIGARAERDSCSKAWYKRIRHSNAAHKAAQFVKGLKG